MSYIKGDKIYVNCEIIGYIDQLLIETKKISPIYNDDPYSLSVKYPPKMKKLLPNYKKIIKEIREIIKKSPKDEYVAFSPAQIFIICISARGYTQKYGYDVGNHKLLNLASKYAYEFERLNALLFYSTPERQAQYKQKNDSNVRRKEMRLCLNRNTRTVEALDSYERCLDNGDKRFEIIELTNAYYGHKPNGINFSFRLIIERLEHENMCPVGDITLTELKSGENEALIKHIEREVRFIEWGKFKRIGKIFYLQVPYLLRAQNSSNRTGYGWEWHWHGYDEQHWEGTLYGETTSYVISGIML